MGKPKRSAAFKRKVALDALREDKTMGEIASKHGVHPVQVGVWKKQLIDGSEAIFEDKRKKKKDDEITKDGLERKIGQLTIEIDYLKKKLGY